MAQPSLFISHGAPDIAVKTEHPSYRFLSEVSTTFARPDAIVIFSAHWGTDRVLVSSADSYKAIYDFGGFDRRLYTMQYSPKGVITSYSIHYTKLYDILQVREYFPNP